MRNLNSGFNERAEKFGRMIAEVRGKRDGLRGRLSALESEANEICERMARIDKCLEVLKLLSEAKRREVKEKLESLVTAGLREVFGRSDYAFEFEMEVKRGSMTAVPMLESDFMGEIMRQDIVDGHGGGIVDVAAFLLQLVVLMALRGQEGLEKVMVMDEPFKHVSRANLPAVAAFMRHLRDVTQMQFLMVTHKTEFAEVADKLFRVTQDRKTGVTEIREEKK